MTIAVPLLLVDCSVVVKWKIPSEPHAAEARELFLDWQHDAVQVCVPDQLFAEMMNALLGACRRRPPRILLDEARTAVQEVLALPFAVFRTTGRRIITRA